MFTYFAVSAVVDLPSQQLHDLVLNVCKKKININCFVGYKYGTTVADKVNGGQLKGYQLRFHVMMFQNF